MSKSETATFCLQGNEYKGGIVIEVLGLMGFSFGMIGFIFATTVQTRVALLEKRVKKLEAQLDIKSPPNH